MNSEEILEEIKRIMNIKTDSALAQVLKINQSQISRWKKTGFYPSTNKLFNAIVKEYNLLERELEE